MACALDTGRLIGTSLLFSVRRSAGTVTSSSASLPVSAATALAAHDTASNTVVPRRIVRMRSLKLTFNALAIKISLVRSHGPGRRATHGDCANPPADITLFSCHHRVGHTDEIDQGYLAVFDPDITHHPIAAVLAAFTRTHEVLREALVAARR